MVKTVTEIGDPTRSNCGRATLTKEIESTSTVVVVAVVVGVTSIELTGVIGWLVTRETESSSCGTCSVTLEFTPLAKSISSPWLCSRVEETGSLTKSREVRREALSFGSTLSSGVCLLGITGSGNPRVSKLERLPE